MSWMTFQQAEPENQFKVTSNHQIDVHDIGQGHVRVGVGAAVGPAVGETVGRYVS